jgi:tetratricopeptide (TPR) repeat protein
MPGPSKEELENYFRNSRQYFDELAKYYQESDREYYDKNIAPFYNNPFRRSGSGGGKIAVFAGMLLVFIAGLAVFLMVGSESKKEDKRVEKEEVISSQKKADATDSVAVKNTKEYYEKGKLYFDSEDYENAEKYLKLVPRKDRNYSDAVRMLKKIEEKKIEKEKKDERRVKAQPLQRIN